MGKRDRKPAAQQPVSKSTGKVVTKNKKAARVVAARTGTRFDRRYTKPKFEVVGRRGRGHKNERVQSEIRAKAIEKRKGTLGIELKRKGIVNSFVDRRFGEDDETLTEEDRILMRFEKERRKQSQKQRMFALEDDDGGEDDGEPGGLFGGREYLTHKGVPLIGGGGTRLIDEIMEGEGFGGLRKRRVARHLQESFEEKQEQEKKSRRQIIKEIIAKSKLIKFERNQNKIDQVQLTEKLDEQFDDIRTTLLQGGSDPQPGDDASTPHDNAEESAAVGATPTTTYERQLVELATDKRVQPAERTLSADERAAHEYARLEQLERERVRRMVLEDGDSGEDTDTDDSAGEDGEGLEGRSDHDSDADDEPRIDMALVEGLSFVEKRRVMRKMKRAAKRAARKAAAPAEGRQDDRRPSSKEDDNPSKDADKQPSMDEHSIPYTFVMPDSVEELAILLHKYMDVAEDGMSIVLERLCACLHPSLSEDNPGHLRRLFGYLMDLFIAVAEEGGDGSRPMIHGLGRCMFRMLQESADSGAQVCHNLVLDAHTTFEGSARAWPSVGVLCAIQLLGRLFPRSDARHRIITPALGFIGEILQYARVSNRKETMMGVFACDVAAFYVRPAKRFMGEPLLFLGGLFHLMGGHREAGHVEQVSPALVGVARLVEIPHNDPDACHAEGLSGPDDWASAGWMGMLEEGPTAWEEGVTLGRLMAASLSVFSRFAVAYVGYEAYTEIFAWADQGLRSMHERLTEAQIQGDLVRSIEAIREHIRIVGTGMTAARRPLQLLEKRTGTIAMLAPKFEEAYSLTKDYDPDRDRSERKKLIRQIKSERKGAMRELRKDGMFLERERAKKRKREDEEYQSKLNAINAVLQQQAAEGNALERMRVAREKRRKRERRG